VKSKGEQVNKEKKRKETLQEASPSSPRFSNATVGGLHPRFERGEKISEEGWEQSKKKEEEKRLSRSAEQSGWYCASIGRE